MKTLMLLTNAFRPDPRVEKEASALTMAGHEVTVIAWGRGGSEPRNEELDGTNVIRVRAGSAVSKKGLLARFPSFYIKVLRTTRNIDFDIVHAHDLDTLPLGVLLSRLRGVPLIYDAHEHYAMMVADDLPGPVCLLLDRLEGVLVRRADAVIGANESILAYLSRNVKGISDVVMNCIDPPQGLPRSMGGYYFYGGSLEPLRFLPQVLAWFSEHPDQRLRLAGDGSLRSIVESMAKDHPNIEFMGYMPHREMLREMASSIAVLVLLEPSNENNRIGTPNRLFEAMALGVPVIAVRDTLSGRIVEENGCGVTIDDVHGDMDGAVRILHDAGRTKVMGDNGIKAVKDLYNWTSMRDRLIRIYALMNERN